MCYIRLLSVYTGQKKILCYDLHKQEIRVYPCSAIYAIKKPTKNELLYAIARCKHEETRDKLKKLLKERL